MLLFKSIIARIISSGVRVWMILSFKLRGYKQARIGKCWFWGPGDFLESADEAMKRLADLDEQLYSEVISTTVAVYWYHTDDLIEDRISKCYSITQNCVGWGPEGIIMRVVSTFFLNRRLGFTAYSKEDNITLHNEIRRTTFQWLVEHKFPQELCNSFNTMLAKV